MSYTMTIESPEKAAWFEEQRATMSDAELVIRGQRQFSTNRNTTETTTEREQK